MLQKKLSEQQKTIQYIKDKYKQKTGQQIVLPKNWEDYLIMDEDQVPIQQLPQQLELRNANKFNTNIYKNFQQKFNSYHLPSRISYTKAPFTNFTPTNTFHMVQTIQLDGFKDNGFSKVTFRQLLNRIVQMRCLKALSLSGNGIDDTCTQQIETLFGTMKKITRINLSRNKMQKTCLQIISKNFNHLEWIDIARNQWIFQFMTLQNLINAVRTNTKLFHLSIDLQDERLVKQLVSYLKIKTNINSFALIDSKYDVETMTSLVAVLQPLSGKKESPNRIINLNFNFCYLQTQPFNILLKALSNNTSLICLNLSSNQLMESKAISLLSVIESHLCLTQLNLSNNELEDKFAIKLAEILTKNQILQQINIQRNNIGDEGARQLYKTLSENNETLQDLGKLQTNQRISVQYIQKISKALRINKISKQIRAQLSNLQGELTAAQIANKQTQAFLQAQYQQYQLLQPISITNPLKQDPYKINLWQFD